LPSQAPNLQRGREVRLDKPSDRSIHGRTARVME
jgi:hypothetical protein